MYLIPNVALWNHPKYVFAISQHVSSSCTCLLVVFQTSPRFCRSSSPATFPWSRHSFASTARRRRRYQTSTTFRCSCKTNDSLPEAVVVAAAVCVLDPRLSCQQLLYLGRMIVGSWEIYRRSYCCENMTIFAMRPPAKPSTVAAMPTFSHLQKI